MSSEDIEARHKIRNINRKIDFYNLLDECMLSEKEKLLKKIKEELIEDECEEG